MGNDSIGVDVPVVLQRADVVFNMDHHAFAIYHGDAAHTILAVKAAKAMRGRA
jgi:hypothetical protein